MSRVYIVVCECGMYSDWTTSNESAHETYEGAVRAIEGQVETFHKRLDGRVPCVANVFDESYIAPGPCEMVFQHPRRYGNEWHLPWGGLCSGDFANRSWHIEEMEVGR